MKDLKEMKDRLVVVLSKIDKLQGTSDYTDAVAKSFHLGMVGGSGRGKNIHALNRKRAASLDKTIDRATQLVPLYKERDELIFKINDVESGNFKKREENKANADIKLAEYWKGLKAGDMVDVGGNSPAKIIKKSQKSIITETGCKWSVAEIIGKKAAQLI